MTETMPMNERSVIYINMLGGFRLSVGDAVTSDAVSHTHQLWNLLEYLIAFRNKTISQGELIEALWPNNSSDNPANALKNLVYRIRTTFAAQNIPYAKDMIVFSRGSYRWNNELPCEVDIERFEELSRDAGLESDPHKKVDAYLTAIDLYRGDFLPGSSYEEWVVPLASYFRSIYFKNVYTAANLLMEMERYDDLRVMCERAIIIDPFEENANRYYILSLIRQNKQSAALEHYNHVMELFYRELGVRPSESIRALYREITKTINSVETDLSIIKEDLSEGRNITSAFYCDYEVFKNLYRLEARAATRSGQSIFIALLTVTDGSNNVPELKLLSTVMDHLLSIIRQGLRKGDVISRFSSTQFVLMLPALTYENGQMVLDRVSKKFKASFRYKNIRLHTTLQPLDPI